MKLVSDTKALFLTLNQKYLFLLLLLAYLSICFAYHFLPSGVQSYPYYLLVYSVHFSLYGGILWMLRGFNPRLSWIFVGALLARIIVIPSDPVLENDYWRYLWDGRVLAHGVNPYSYKPLDHALDYLDVYYRQQIGWKQYGTIYPPVSILTFAMAHLLAPDSLLGLKIVLTIFEVATGVVLLLWLQKGNISLKWSALYLLNPLLLKEISNSAHLDAIVVFFSTLSVYLMWITGERKSASLSAAAWISLALAVASKIYPICFIPLFLKIDRWRWRGAVIFLLCLLLIYIPFLKTGYNLFNGTEAFAKHWIFNASVYKIIQKTVSISIFFFKDLNLLTPDTAVAVMQNERFPKFIVGSLFTAFVYLRMRSLEHIDRLPHEITNVLGALLILSPVVNGWYLLWVLPFTCIARYKPWLIFSYTVVAGYAWWYSKELAFYLKWLEYLILFLSLYIWQNGFKKKIAVKTDI